MHIATKVEDDFRLRADQLRAAITPRTKLLILPYPNNPTGGVMDAADLEAIAEVLRGTNIMVLSDEIYAELTYGLDRHISIATLPGMKERTIVVNGFSKAYAMTGWGTIDGLTIITEIAEIQTDSEAVKLNQAYFERILKQKAEAVPPKQ